MNSKTFSHILVSAQLCLMCAGVWMITRDVIFLGLFNIIINAIFIPLNIKDLKE